MLRGGGGRRIAGGGRPPTRDVDGERSKAIARLEQTSGVKLLHRSTHAVSLTQDGEQLLELAREVVRAAADFSRSAGIQNQESGAGWVRVTAPVAFMRDVLTPLFAAFSRDNPSIRLDLR